MKTKTKINTIARMGFAALAITLISALVPVRAGNESDSALNRNNTAALGMEVEAAYNRLDMLNNNIEKSVKFSAPAVTEDIRAYEVQAAEERLENLNLNVEAAVRYTPSMVNEEIEAYELATAKERLEDLNLAVEASIRFSAPGLTDAEIFEISSEGTMEYATNRYFTIPAVATAINTVLAR
jgi:hypothetical protein